MTTIDEDFSPFDPAEHLKSEEAIAEYLRCSADDTPEEFLDTLDIVARARAALRHDAPQPAPAMSLSDVQGFSAVVNAVRSMGYSVTFTPAGA